MMPDSPLRLLFPRRFRDLPRRRLILNLLRAAHIISFSLLLGGLYYGVADEAWRPWLLAAVLSGLALFAVDLYGSFLALFEIRGISVLIKIGLLSLLPLVDANTRLAGLMSIIVFSSLVSHSTRRFRHRSLAPAAFLRKYAPTDPPTPPEK